MQKKRWIYWAMLFVIPGLMFSVSCQKKLVDATPEPVVQEEVAEEVVVEEEVAALGAGQPTSSLRLSIVTLSYKGSRSETCAAATPLSSADGG